MTRILSLVADQPPAVKSADDSRPALAVFCWENPDTPVRPVRGPHGRRPGPATDGRPSVFAPTLRARTSPAVHEHRGRRRARATDLFEQVQEFTSRAANAFLHEFPGGSPHVTLMGYEWSGAGPLGLLRGLKNNRTIFSFNSLERQRSDMTAEISKRIDELEQTTLRESQVVLSQQPAASEAASFWVPDCAARLVAARQPFPVAAVQQQDSIPARSRPATRSARSIPPSSTSAT